MRSCTAALGRLKKYLIIPYFSDCLLFHYLFRSAVDDSKVILSRAKTALKLLDNDESRLWLAPDCGLGFLPVDIAQKKLANMVNAANCL